MKDNDGNSFKIKVSEDGPCIVTGGIPLSKQKITADNNGYSYEWTEEEKYPLKKTYSLCRCGSTKKKPFCDGSHVEVKFDGTETASHEPYLNQAEEINGPDLDLTDAIELCSYARFCERDGGIWELTQQSGRPEARKTAIQEAGNCPSGRLVVWDKEGKAIEPVFEPSIVLVEDPQEGVSGPLWVRGGIRVEAADGTIYEIRNRVTLCRCGRSVNKPLCDSGHIEIRL